MPKGVTNIKAKRTIEIPAFNKAMFAEVISFAKNIGSPAIKKNCARKLGSRTNPYLNNDETQRRSSKGFFTDSTR